MTPPILSRHPELVSGSISPPARSQRWQANAHRKVSPFGIRVVDQIDLPRSVPALELFLALDGADHVSEHFEINQPVDRVSCGVSGQGVVPVLPHPAEQVGGDSNIQRSVVPACEDIDAGVAFLSHGSELAARWTLKQVQGDGACYGGLVA